MRVPPNNYDSELARRYHASMAGKNDNLINFIATTVEALRTRVDMISEQMATKVDLANLRDEMATKDDLAALRNETRADLVAIRNEMATKDGLIAIRNEMATKNDLGRLETTMRGEFEQVHIRMDSIDRRVGTRMGQIETDLSRLRSVVYLLVKDKPDMLRLLDPTTPRENLSEG
jgi:hypothetical protein